MSEIWRCWNARLACAIIDVCCCIICEGPKAFGESALALAEEASGGLEEASIETFAGIRCRCVGRARDLLPVPFGTESFEIAMNKISGIVQVDEGPTIVGAVPVVPPFAESRCCL